MKPGIDKLLCLMVPLYTLCTVLCSVHCALHTVYSALCTVCCIQYTVHCTVHCVLCKFALCTVNCAMCSRAIFTVHCVLCNVSCTSIGELHSITDLMDIGNNVALRMCHSQGRIVCLGRCSLNSIVLEVICTFSPFLPSLTPFLPLPTPFLPLPPLLPASLTSVSRQGWLR